MNDEELSIVGKLLVLATKAPHGDNFEEEMERQTIINDAKRLVADWAERLSQPKP